MNPITLAKLSKADRTLAKIIRKSGPMRFKPEMRRPYEALIEAIVYQQLNGTAAATILGRVKALYPEKKFPKPEDLVKTPDELLRSAGLSRAKTLAVKDVAARTIDGTVPPLRVVAKLSDAAIIERLIEIRGVGQWTVEMLLIFNLGRPDVLPAADYGVRKGFALAYGWDDLPSPKELLEYGERWKPYRTTAAWYMWRAVELYGGRK